MIAEALKAKASGRSGCRREMAAMTVKTLKANGSEHALRKGAGR